jgi:putative DNA primase/helicase
LSRRPATSSGSKDDDDDGQGKAVIIADVAPWLDPVEGDYVAEALAAAFKTYAVLPDHVPEVIALWVLHTYTVNCFSISPRLAITSPTKGCGKTTILRLLYHVARRAKRAGSISPPALFRVVEMFQPTLLLDETEKYIEHGGDIHALLNEGHAIGGKVLRVLGDKLELREFNLFGPVAFARNGKLPDDLEQRSIVVEMKRRLPDEQLAELRDDRAEALQRVARMCARWAEDNEDEIKEADPDMGDLINRVADNWRPLFAIADAIGGEWPEIARAGPAAMAPKDSDSIGTMLLADIKVVFDGLTGEWADRVFSEMLTEALHSMEGKPWAEFGKARKPITKNQLAQMLKGFKVTPETIYEGGGRANAKKAKGYATTATNSRRHGSATSHPRPHPRG